MGGRSVSMMLAGAALLAPGCARAWGNEGHQVVATIARAYLTPGVRAKVDAILAKDADTLTRPDMVSRATWADAWRDNGHRETASWHFVDIELAGPDLDGACFGHPRPATPPSAGPAQDCVVDKIDEFRAELGARGTAPAERLLALKYLLHFVGDIHQPLHAADNADRGGNCVRVLVAGGRATNLHSYWDTAVVEAMGTDPATVGRRLRAAITPAQLAAWRKGSASDWARESFAVAQSVAYRLGSPAGCPDKPQPVTLPPDYPGKAGDAAAEQLRKAGVRLAMVLNVALADVRVAGTPRTGGRHRTTRRRHTHSPAERRQEMTAPDQPDRPPLPKRGAIPTPREEIEAAPRFDPAAPAPGKRRPDDGPDAPDPRGPDPAAEPPR